MLAQNPGGNASLVEPNKKWESKGAEGLPARLG
jgi:hypothetical protein